jgi:hypothetical protein
VAPGSWVILKVAVILIIFEVCFRVLGPQRSISFCLASRYPGRTFSVPSSMPRSLITGIMVI